MSKWQPIDTAPKDGTRVLVACPARAGTRASSPYEHDVMIAHQDALSWDNGSWRLHEKPRYWMPLPSPPIDKATTTETALAERDIPLTTTSAGARLQQLDTQLLEYTHDAIIIWEMNGAGILYWNRAAEQLYGYSRGEAHGQTTHRLLKTELVGGVTQLESDLAKFGVWVGELRHTTHAGRRIDVEGRLALMSQQNGHWLVLEVNRDITDRKVADSGRRAMERQLAQLRAIEDVYQD